MSNPYRMTDQGYGVASFKSGGAFLFDEIDLPLIERHTWHLGKRGYPATHYHGRTVVFHRLLFPDADGEVDHINGDKMDNAWLDSRAFRGAMYAAQSAAGRFRRTKKRRRS